MVRLQANDFEYCSDGPNCSHTILEHAALKRALRVTIAKDCGDTGPPTCLDMEVVYSKVDCRPLVFCLMSDGTNTLTETDMTTPATDAIAAKSDCQGPDYERTNTCMSNAAGKWQVTSFVNTADITDIIGPVFTNPNGVVSPDPGDLIPCVSEVTTESVSEIDVCADGEAAIKKTVVLSDGTETTTFETKDGTVVTPTEWTPGACDPCANAVEVCDWANTTELDREDFETPSTTQGTGLGGWSTEFTVSQQGQPPHWGQLFNEGIYRVLPVTTTPVSLNTNWVASNPLDSGYAAFNLAASGGALDLKVLYRNINVVAGNCYRVRFEAVDPLPAAFGGFNPDLKIEVDGVDLGNTGPIADGTPATYTAEFNATTTGSVEIALRSNITETVGNDLLINYIVVEEAEMVLPEECRDPVVVQTLSEVPICADGLPAVRKTCKMSDGSEVVTLENETGEITPTVWNYGVCSKDIVSFDVEYICNQATGVYDQRVVTTTNGVAAAAVVTPTTTNCADVDTSKDFEESRVCDPATNTTHIITTAYLQDNTSTVIGDVDTGQSCTNPDVTVLPQGRELAANVAFTFPVATVRTFTVTNESDGTVLVALPGTDITLHERGTRTWGNGDGASLIDVSGVTITATDPNADVIWEV